MVIKGIPTHVWKKLPIEIWHEIYLYAIYNGYWKLNFRSIPLEYIWDFSVSKTKDKVSLYYKNTEIDSIILFHFI